jgi:SAM-dependent methyltransferase
MSRRRKQNDEGSSDRAAQLAAARDFYDPVLARGVDVLFEPRRTTCPWCCSPALRVRLRSKDLIQRKPGRFTVEACRSCGHQFQNPRLTLDGLDFYYRDFYDGLGADVAEYAFAQGRAANLSRARAVAAHGEPGNWLDVGTGHAHFPLHAAEILPTTAFDGLDLSAGVDEAVRLGRIRTGHRGLFPELAPKIAGAYDVVSMHHYLEHTREPRTELDALAQVVRAGGLVEIEMPDVSAPLGGILRSWWAPWFQPQHQHFIPVANLMAALRERGFRILRVQRHEAHTAVDLTYVAMFLVIRFAADPDSPWTAAHGGAWRKRRHRVAWSTVFPALAKVAYGGDTRINRLLRVLDQGNAYRIVARKGSR